MKRYVICALLACGATSLAWADGKQATMRDHYKAQDDYYASDLDAAISEAKERTHHYDYSSEFRYERTTSQSIRFSRMLNDELDEQVVESESLGAPAAGPENDQGGSGFDSLAQGDQISLNDPAQGAVPATAQSVSVQTNTISVTVRNR